MIRKCDVKAYAVVTVGGIGSGMRAEGRGAGREIDVSGPSGYGFTEMSPISVRMAWSTLRIRASSTVLE